MQEYTFDEYFGSPLAKGLYTYNGTNSSPVDIPDEGVRVTFDITEDMVGCRFGSSERYSGSGSKTCKLFFNGKQAQKRNVGTGQCFQQTIDANDVGEGYFTYVRQSGNNKNLKTGAEVYCM
jgi:hypothetical protein